MIYDYLLTAFRVIVGLLTTERLIWGAILGVVFYLFWIGASLLFSFQRKFNRNCVKLYNFVKKSQFTANDVNAVDSKASVISSGFSHGWKKFKASAFGKPSDFITRREALDVEVTGGVLNQGKSFMKAYIDLSTFVVFMVNLAYLGSSNSITCYLIAEAMVLPLIYYIVCKVFYFLYTSIKQQLYKSDIECLYELLDLLDSVFVKSNNNVLDNSFSAQMVQGEDVIIADDGDEIGVLENIPEDIPEDIPEESITEEDESEKTEVLSEISEGTDLNENKNVNIVDKYDIFKKKNIDVDKLLNEIPNKSSSLPYINVDSDYVINDDDKNTVISKNITNLENGSELLGGMIQDMSSIKNAQKQSENVSEESKESAESSKEDADENKDESKEISESEKKDENKVVDNENKSFDAQPENEIIDSLDDAFGDDSKNEDTLKSDDSALEEIEDSIPENNDVQLVENENQEVSDADFDEEPDVISEKAKENIANVIGGFKSKSKLASGGVVIERNEPISRRERVSDYEQNSEPEMIDDEFDKNQVYQSNYSQKSTITQLSAENNADDVLNSFRNSAGGYDNYQGYNAGIQSGMYNQGYNNTQYNQNYSGFRQAYNQPMAPNYGVQGYQNISAQGYDVYQQQNYNNSFDLINQQFEDDVEEFVEVAVDEQKPAKVKRSKEDEPRPRNLKKKEGKKTMVETTPEKKRGRPKKQVFDESVSIKNDKEFDEVLARAEKLMRKSEQGLSASQAKRIEKELKMLMDAMNKYKEGV